MKQSADRFATEKREVQPPAALYFGRHRTLQNGKIRLFKRA